MGDIRQIPNHQVKVDNWPLFFLQRLNHFYRKKSHCDLTLLFSTLGTVKSIKVHKLVLHACTDYFESLDVTKDSEHGEVLKLSNEMHPDVVIPIISFMYTGRLEFPVTLQPRLYEAAIKLRMTILTKLLDVQANANEKKSSQSSDDSLTRVSIFQNEAPSVSDGSKDIQVSVSEVSQLSVPSSSKATEDSIITLMPMSVSASQTKPSAKPEVTIVQRADGVFIKNADQVKPKIIKKTVGLPLATVSSKSKVVDANLPPILPGRKLPVWKRKVLLTESQTILENVQTVRSTFRPLDLPKPTRFEWEEDLNDPTSLGSVEDALKNLSHDGTTKVSYPKILDEEEVTTTRSTKVTAAPTTTATTTVAATATPTVVSNATNASVFTAPTTTAAVTTAMSQPKPTEVSDDSLKRSSDGSNSESPPPSKRPKIDLQEMKELGKQTQLRNEIICSEDNSDDMMDNDDLYGGNDDESVDMSTFNQSSVASSTPKPILKTVSKPELPMASKRVRFSLEGKENNQQQNETTPPPAPPPPPPAPEDTKKSETPVVKQKIILPMDVNQIQSGKHYVKIVSEVLKKYPNLAKRDNVKLKVVSKNPAAVPPTVQQAVEGDANTGNKSSSSLVSYIFLSNKSSGDLLTVVKGESSEKDKPFDVENRTGPWFCQVCDEANPINFDSYYTYRRHLVEVHELKIDARICEYCGVRTSKKNHLLYHLYTKHGIDPPAHVSFPKCPDCDYIALSDVLLLKHKRSHDPKTFTCYVCNVVYKNYSSMQTHLHSNWHKSKLKNVSIIVSGYPCPFCDARFDSGNDLKEHMEANHHSQNAPQTEGKQIYRCPYCEGLFEDGDKLGKHVMSLHWGKNSQVSSQETTDGEALKPQSGQQLQFTEEESEASNDVESSNLRPSSELESLSNVASGIATSLNLVGNEQTVVFYEQDKSEDQDIGREATIISGDECKDYIISPAVEVSNRDIQTSTDDDNLETLKMDSEDSNSRTSNTEEVNPTSCSDHDYSEPQVDEGLRQLIPVQQIPTQIAENQVIQQILPDQRLMFSQGNVLFQSPCVALPQRVVLTSGKMVLPQITPVEQNVILSQVLPQTRIILSAPILQPGGGIIDTSMHDENTIVFASSEPTDQLENLQSVVQYPLQETETLHEEKPAAEEMIVDVEDDDEEEEESNQEKEEEKEEDGEVSEEQESETESKEQASEENETSSITEQEIEEVEECDDTREVQIIESSVATPTEEEPKTGANRVETSKIVDDWDETNESQQNVENARIDGPIRPEFF